LLLLLCFVACAERFLFFFFFSGDSDKKIAAIVTGWESQKQQKSTLPTAFLGAVAVVTQITWGRSWPHGQTISSAIFELGTITTSGSYGYGRCCCHKQA